MSGSSKKASSKTPKSEESQEQGSQATGQSDATSQDGDTVAQETSEPVLAVQDNDNIPDISAEEMAESHGILDELLEIIHKHRDATRELKDASIAVVHERVQDVLSQIRTIERPVVDVSIGELVVVKTAYGFLHLVERHVARKVAAQKKAEESGPELGMAPAPA